MSLRPGYQRASSTNLKAAAAERPLEGKLAVITGGSRGPLPPTLLHCSGKVLSPSTRNRRSDRS